MTTYEWSDRIDSLERSRMFVVSILHEAYASGNELQKDEFELKLAAIDEELKQLLK